MGDEDARTLDTNAVARGDGDAIVSNEPRVRDLVHDIVAEIAPGELPIVNGLAQFDDVVCVRRLRRRRRKREPLGFGLGEVVVLVTPVVWLTLDQMARRFAASGVDSATTRPKHVFRKIFWRHSPAATMPHLTREQLAEVHQRVIEVGVSHGMPERNAAAVAATVVTRLVLAFGSAYSDEARVGAEQWVLRSDSAMEFEPGPNPRITICMGFAIDIINFTMRSAPERDALQRRLANIIPSVLTDMGVGAKEARTQTTGDGMNVILPQSVELHRALPQLLRSWHEHVGHDNQYHHDRMRLRLAIGIGPTGDARLGFSGDTIIQVSRLLDSDVLRQAAKDHPDADLVALVSDQLYQWVVGEGHHGLDPTQFQQVQAVAKTFAATAWLWVNP